LTPSRYANTLEDELGLDVKARWKQDEGGLHIRMNDVGMDKKGITIQSESTSTPSSRCATAAVALGVILILASAAQAATPVDRRVKDIMALSEKELLAVVPQQCPDVKCACPKCAEYVRWRWSYKKPFQIQCAKCGTVYPNEQYPMNRTATYLNFIGEKIALPYHRGRKPKGGFAGRPHPERYFLNAPIDDRRYHWLSGQAIPRLVDAYKATGKDVYARRVALILDRFAQNYKHYLVHRGRGQCYYVSTGGPCMVDGKKQGTVGEDLPYSWIDTRLVKCWISELNLRFVDAYAAVKGSAALDRLSAEMGVDVRKRIEDDLISEMCDFMLLVPWKYQLANNLPTLSWIARAGRAIGKPEYVHVAYRYLNEVITSYGRDTGRAGYAYDLHNPEGNQCHYGMRRAFYGTFKAIEGWSDPPGYKGKRDGVHLENLSLEKDFPLVARSAHVPDVYRLPNGALNPIHDTVGYRGQGGDIGPLKESRCRLLPGFGQGVLGDGQGGEQVQVQLHFSPDNANHCHKDCMSVVWYAHGREMSGEIGYQRNKLRSWAAGTLSHNTVVVNRAGQTGGDTSGNLLCYIPDLPGLSLIQVDGMRAYEGLGVKRYRRTLILNTIEIQKPYFIDIFEVEGGRTHDYAMHGSVFGDMVGSASLPMQAMPAERPLLEAGERWQEPKGMGPFNHYGLFRNVKAGRATQDFYVDFTCRDAPGTGTRIHMLRDDQMEVFLGETPALRKAGHYRDQLVYKWQMPHLIARRAMRGSRVEDRGSRGQRGELKSVFVAVYDMFQGRPKITSVRRLRQDEHMVALRIALGDRTDTLLYAFGQPQAMSAGGMEANGKLGLVAERDGRADGYLIAGTSLRKGELRLSARPGSYTGVVTGAARKLDGGASDAFITAAELPTGAALWGKWLVLTHGRIRARFGRPVPPDAQGVSGAYGAVTHAYEIDRIEKKRGKTWIHLTRDHGLRMEGNRTTEVFSMWRTYEGQEKFVIHTHAATVGRPGIEKQIVPNAALFHARDKE